MVEVGRRHECRTKVFCDWRCLSAANNRGGLALVGSTTRVDATSVRLDEASYNFPKNHATVFARIRRSDMIMSPCLSDQAPIAELFTILLVKSFGIGTQSRQ